MCGTMRFEMLIEIGMFEWRIDIVFMAHMPMTLVSVLDHFAGCNVTAPGDTLFMRVFVVGISHLFEIYWLPKS